MSSITSQRQFEDILLEIRQPARLIGGEPGAGPGFGRDPAELRVVLGFPDTYEIGISNQAIQILYHLARQVAGVAVERTYLPWTDAISAMRRHRVSLLTLETWSPVVCADLLGVTLQHELNYTNVLEMLDLAGIPLHTEKRTGAHPLVLAGGPACANFLPLSRFLDAVVIGDGEEVFPEILEALAEAKREGISREQIKGRLSLIEGVFVPGVSCGVTRRTLYHLEGAPYPDSCLVPLTAGVHDRAWVEIMRGCTRGCRFCQAGMWYRPVRERPPDEVIRMADTQLRSTGHRELAFASLSTTDYSCVEYLLQSAAEIYPDVCISLPSLRVDSAAVRLAHLVSPTGPSLTLAPEAGSQRMRDIINKNVTGDDIMAAAREAFRSGRTTLKLYFMIGLPLEEDADVAAIADLCLNIRDLGRHMLGARAGRLQLHVSVNNFVPKPFTPFQWSGMAGREDIVRRQNLLRSRLRRPGIRLALHDADKSFLEAALARGADGMGAVIERAWECGARFDSWTEEFRDGAWREAFAAIGTSAEALATAALSTDVALPWDLIRGVVTSDFLRAEWERAGRGECTGDCRWDGCADCGACSGFAGNDLATMKPLAESGQRGPCSPAGVLGRTYETRAKSLAGGGSDVSRPTGQKDRVEGGCRHRYLATFSVTGRGRFVGHLDRTEAFRRAVRKAGGRLALSAGMRPKPLLSIAVPLAVGVEGLRELCEFELAEEAGPDFFSRLACALPVGIELLALEPYAAARSLPARVIAATYEVGVRVMSVTPEGSELGDVLTEACVRFEEAGEILVEETREGRVRRVDVKRYVGCVSMQEGPGLDFTLTFRVAVTPYGTARPERVIEALVAVSGVKLQIEGIRRIEVHLS